MKQNITRDIEVKNNLTIARGAREGTVGRRVFRTTIKDTWTKPRGRVEAGEGGGFGWGGGKGWGEMQTPELNNNKIILKINLFLEQQ